MKIFPVTKLGEVVLFLAVVGIVILLIYFTFMALGYVSFDIGHWWDIVVGIVAPLSVVLIIIGMVP